MGRVALIIIDAEANANTTAAKNALALALDIIIFFERFERKGRDVRRGGRGGVDDKNSLSLSVNISASPSWRNLGGTTCSIGVGVGVGAWGLGLHI